MMGTTTTDLFLTTRLSGSQGSRLAFSTARTLRGGIPAQIDCRLSTYAEFEWLRHPVFRKSGKVQFQWLAGGQFLMGILCTPLWALPRRLEPAAEDDMAVAEWPLTVSLHHRSRYRCAQEEERQT